MAVLEGKALSNVDAAWLRMESATNLMLITGVMSFYEKLEFSELKELIEDRLLSFDRFRQKVVESPIPGIGPRWVDDPHFNLKFHLQRVALPAPPAPGVPAPYSTAGSSNASEPSVSVPVYDANSSHTPTYRLARISAVPSTGLPKK